MTRPPSRNQQRQARRLHRWLVPIAAAPLLLTAGTGSLYSLLLEQDIDAFWLLKIHTGDFGPINLQPIYSVILGFAHRRRARLRSRAADQDAGTLKSSTRSPRSSRLITKPKPSSVPDQRPSSASAALPSAASTL